MPFNHQTYNQTYLKNIQAGGAPINDAAGYGVRVIEANVPPGTPYWRIIGIHHLLPAENMGMHNIFLEALDENGQRVRNPIAWAGWTWESRQPNERADPVALDKPDYETAGNIAMFFGQKVSVWINGRQPTATDPTDKVENLHTAHPDEQGPGGENWNSVGHHSFYVVFQRAIKGGPVEPARSVIYGKVTNGAGYTLLLTKGNEVIERVTLPASTEYRFEKLKAGVYTLAVLTTEVQQPNIAMDGTNTREINLEISPKPEPDKKTIAHYLLFGPAGSRGQKVNVLLAQDYSRYFAITSGYRVDEAKLARRVTIIGEGISPAEQAAIRASGSQLEVLDGDAYNIEAELQRRIDTGQPFPGAIARVTGGETASLLRAASAGLSAEIAEMLNLTGPADDDEDVTLL